MSFTTAGADNPFDSGNNLANVSLDPTVDHSDHTPVSTPNVASSPFDAGGVFSTALGISTTINSTTRDIELVSSGGSVRPTSGMVYPRRTD